LLFYAFAYVDIYPDSYTLGDCFINENFISLIDIVDGMLDRDNRTDSINVRRPLIIRSLRRSNVRKKIAEYLFDISPSSRYTSEIAYNIKTTPTNVIGALRGMGTRYKEEESLLNLDMVEEKTGGKNIKLYSLTQFGKEIVKTLYKKE